MSDQMNKLPKDIVKKANKLKRNQLKNSGIKIPTGKMRKNIQAVYLENGISASEMIILDRN